MRENPAWSTWPTAHNTEGWNLRNKQRLKANIELVIKFKRRERWQLLKAELGQEYLERVRESFGVTPLELNYF